MTSEIIGIIVLYMFIIGVAYLLGKYIANVYTERKTILDFLSPLERIFFRLSGIDPQKEMTWKQHLTAFLTINAIWFVWVYIILVSQDFHFWNPDGNPSMTPDLAFNTAISFMTNTNLQHYSGETGVSYLTQIFAFCFMMFVSAASGMAIMVPVFNSMRQQTTSTLGNFYNYFVKTNTRILLPLSIIVALILAFNGTPMTGEGKGQTTFISMEGDTVQTSRGPAAAMIAIKQLGTNGGGFLGINSSHPFENPNAMTNIVEIASILLIPIALVFALGFYLDRKRLSRMIFGVMTIGFLMMLIPTVIQEFKGNPELTALGIVQENGALEGKETRLGVGATAFWSIATTSTSNGSVSGMHDSTSPMAGMMQMLDMMINAFYGGVGVGFLNFYVFMILAVFISGLMVGRTPEFLGKKIEAREVKIAALVSLLHPFLILAGTAIACYGLKLDTSLAWLNNPGYHGFSEMLYEFTSASANNGSGFEGLGDNTPFWNIACGLVMLLARFIPIIGAVAIAGSLASKKVIPESSGTLRSDTATFGLMVFSVIMIIAALSFFPALVLGPIAEYFTLASN